MPDWPREWTDARGNFHQITSVTIRGIEVVACSGQVIALDRQHVGAWGDGPSLDCAVNPGVEYPVACNVEVA